MSRPGLLEEIAPTVLVVSCASAVSIGTGLTVDCGPRKFSGKVAHCISWAQGYLVEVELQYDNLWSPCEFMPDGLFNPKCLVCREAGCIPACVKPPCIGN